MSKHNVFSAALIHGHHIHEDCRYQPWGRYDHGGAFHFNKTSMKIIQMSDIFFNFLFSYSI